MREIKEIHAKEEQSLSANEALTLDARITLEGEEIFFLAWSEAVSYTQLREVGQSVNHGGAGEPPAAL